MTTRNWAGNVTFSATQYCSPTSIDELCAIVAQCSGTNTACRAVGTAHSFNTIADTPGVLVSLGNLPRLVTVDPDTMTATASAGLRFGDLANQIHAQGFALPNLASLPHISLGGSVATGTHGSGTSNGSLATAVVGMEFVDATGARRSIATGDAHFEGSVVSLGLLGIVTALTFSIEPTFAVAQEVFDDVPLTFALEHLEVIIGSGYSVSVFTSWQGGTAQVWVKRRIDSRYPEVLDRRWVASGPRHPLPHADASVCTTQGGVAGPWHHRLPHFQLDFTPSSGEELQTEFFVALDRGVDALRAVQALSDELASVIMICEWRTVAADDLWLSMAYGRTSLGIHFTWKPQPERVTEVVRLLEAALAPFDARPHWGKVFTAPIEDVLRRYPKGSAFVDLIERFDRQNLFGNAWTEGLRKPL